MLYLFEAEIVLRITTVWELFCGRLPCVWGVFAFGLYFPKKESLVWGPEGLWELGLIPLILQSWNVTSTLGHCCVLPSSTRDCERQFVILIFIRQVPRRPSIGFSFPLYHPEIPLQQPVLGLGKGMYIVHSFLE